MGKGKPKKEFWLLIVIFLTPIILGSLFFYYNPNFFSQKTVNYGQLIEPIITTDATDILLNNQTSLNGKWTLAYYTNQCHQTCLQALEKINTIKVLTNQNMQRIRHLALLSSSLATIQKDKQPPIAYVKNQNLLNKLNYFPPQTIFLIDPLGNIILSYQTQGINIKKVVKDLERLFKYSRIG